MNSLDFFHHRSGEKQWNNGLEFTLSNRQKNGLTARKRGLSSTLIYG